MKNDFQEREFEKFNSCEIAEQTLLTWLQAGLTLIGFGFAFGSVIALMRQEHFEMPIILVVRLVGLLLILVGFTSIMLALLQHRIKLKSLNRPNYVYKPFFNLSFFVGIVLSFLGLTAFLAILIHIIF
ncbi:hypothetical protein ACFLX2_01470 [Candidatus Dependentiae bacterium]